MRVIQAVRSAVFAGLMSLAATEAAGALSDAESQKLAGEVAAGNTASLERLKQAAESGDPGAQTELGVLYLDGEGVPRDLTQAVNWLQKAAELGSAEAQYRMGTFHAAGRGVPRDNDEASKWYRKAAEWFRKAAEEGSPQAQYRWGTMHATGRGVTQDYAEAAKWYRKAADQGHGMAQSDLGSAYSRGRGVPKDLVESVKWYRKAAEQGTTLAQHNLGISYMEGEGVAKSPAEAMKWFRLAAEQGLGPSQFNLGLGYEDGNGVARDPAEAAKWYRKAVEWGYAPAKEALGRVERTSSSKQLAWQQRMEQARSGAAAGNAFTLRGPSGILTVYNNPRPFCYMYLIPGDWVEAREPGLYRSRDGKAFVGLLFRLAREFEGVAGATLVERAANAATREHEKALGKPLTGAGIAPFESARPGTWKWTATPVREGVVLSGVAPKVFVDLSPEAIVQITAFGTSDDDGLARRIIESLKTTSDPQCYWGELERELKSMHVGR